MRFTNIIALALLVILMPSCKSCKDKKSEEESPEITENGPTAENTLGFGVLNKVKGIWNGPVTSTTPLGGYPEWIVDFRPITENQISAKNELDTMNDIFLSFFIAKYNNQYKVAFRNGGSFGSRKRVSYFLADSVSETANQSFYKFTEIIKGKTRAYTEVIRKADSLIIKSYTNNYNSLPTSAPHMAWKAKLQDTTSATNAVTHFNFPKKTQTIDFSSVFAGQSEAVFYSGSNLSADPYPETAQPYLGKTTVNYTYDGAHTPSSSKKTLLIIMTQPLFSGPVPNTANLKYRSRYVILDATNQSFVFNYMHPGSYYVYALYDNDGNLTASSGDWLSTANTPFTLTALGTTTVSPQINFTIP
ncbi:MAG: hypothetical protein JNM51_11650 [Bacteroidia bacterium]|nr:hypothetical protein [Bacteroidia bacterium]